MAQVINTNIMAINAQRSLNLSQSQMATSLERLSSGLRINRAQDDAAGLALAAGYETEMRASAMKVRNANDGISLARAADSAFAEAQNMLQRILEIKEQGSGIADSADLKAEYDDLVAEVKAQLGNTFNGITINGSTGVTIDGVTIGGTAVDVSALTSTNAQSKLDDLITLRQTYGAQANRLEAKSRYYESQVESYAAAKSRVMDADFAAETANLTRTQILQQAGAAMLAQANALPQNALALLR